MKFSPFLLELADQAEAALAPQFLRLSRISHHNTARVMEAFGEKVVCEEPIKSLLLQT